MYRAAELKVSNLAKMWGWRQNYDTSKFTIAESLTTSLLGQYYQDVHPMLTLDNMKAVAPLATTVAAPAWVNSKEYVVGEKVTVSLITYRAKVVNTNKAPATNPAQWEIWDAFSEWLEQKTQASILSAVRRFWSEKMSEKTLRNILENKCLFNGTGRITDTIVKTNSLVGFEITPIRSNGVTVKIDKIGLQFQGTGAITLYLMHSSRTEPVNTITCTRTRNGGMEWFDVEEIFLPYMSDDNDAGGSWYLVYDENALPSGNLAVNKGRDWSTKPCYSCDVDDYTGWNIWSQYIEVHPLKQRTQKVNRSKCGMFRVIYIPTLKTTGLISKLPLSAI